MAVPLHFRCEFTSPFHTSNRMYGNLYTCAPWVMGSTLRGAVLTQLLHRHCTRIDALNTACDKPACHLACDDAKCPVRPMFTEEDGAARFSFAILRGPMAERTKVGIDRATRSVAESALLTYQIYPTGSGFDFWVRVPDGAEADRVNEAVHDAGSCYGGLGRFRNQGFGRYKVLESGEGSPPLLAASPGEGREWLGQCELRAPYILPWTPAGDNLIQPREFDECALRTSLDRTLGKGWCARCLAELPAVSGLEHVEYDYLSRWCYEDGKRHNRCVILPGAQFTLRFADKPNPADLQELAWGVGEWAYMGFGAIGPVRPDA